MIMVVSIAIVVVAIFSARKNNYRIDPSQELIAIGVCGVHVCVCVCVCVCMCGWVVCVCVGEWCVHVCVWGWVGGVCVWVGGWCVCVGSRLHVCVHVS